MAGTCNRIMSIHDAFINQDAGGLSYLDAGEYEVVAIRCLKTKFGETFVLLVSKDGDLQPFWATPSVKNQIFKEITPEIKKKVADPIYRYLIMDAAIGTIHIIDSKYTKVVASGSAENKIRPSKLFYFEFSEEFQEMVNNDK